MPTDSKKDYARGAQSLRALYGRSVSSVACRSCRVRSRPPLAASLAVALYALSRQPLSLPPSRRAPADTALPSFPLRSQARPSLRAPVRLQPTGSRPAPVDKFRSRPAPRSRPRPRTPSARCVGGTPGDASPVPASSARAGRSSLLGQMTQGDARVLPALILATLRTAQAKRAPLRIARRSRSGRAGLGLLACLRAPVRLLPTDTKEAYGLPTRALAPYSLPLLASAILRGARRQFLRHLPGQVVPPCSGR